MMNLDEVINVCKKSIETEGSDPDIVQISCWLEELRDLRAILSERAPGEAEAETKNEEPDDDDALTLEYYVDSLIDNIQLPVEHEEQFWANQLLRARKRIRKE